MKQTVNLYDFRRAFESVRPDQFSYEGLEVLFDSLESLSDDTGEEVELDVIALCCGFSESTVDEIAENYTFNVSHLDGDEKTEAVMEYLQEHTFVAGQVSNGSIIYADF